MTTAILPPGPRGHFLSGHMAALRRDPLGFLSMCAREYGDFVPLRFGPKPSFLLNHPDYIEYVLVTNSSNFIKGPAARSARRLYGGGLFLSEGSAWRHQRRLIQPAFHRERTAAYADVMIAYTERMLATWRDGEVHDVHQDMMCLTLAIVGKTLFDADVAAQADEVVRALMEALESLTTRLQNLLFLLPDSIPTPSNLRLRRAVRRLDNIVYSIIEQRRASNQDHGDLLSMLLHTQAQDASHGMTDRQLRDEVMNFLLAGHESSAVALSWTWYLLSKHPETEAKLIAELAAVLGGRTPTAMDVPQLQYTEMVILEAMRLYPPVPVLGREAVQDCEIGGYRVMKGAIAIMAQWVMHRHSRYFDYPEVFNPERWTDSLSKRLPRFAYFPFGGGPRLCIGSSFAMLEAVLLLATIAQKFRLTLIPEHPITLQPSSSLFPKYGMKMVLHRR